jgi:hypothetical protein
VRRRIRYTAEIPPYWGTIATVRKTLFGWPVWPEIEHLRSGSAVRTRRDEIRTASTEQTSAVVQLADEHGVTLEGVRLRLRAWEFSQCDDVTATLEVVGGRSFVTVARIDAWPRSPHRHSYKTRKHPKLKHVAEQIDGCHVHRYAHNAVLGTEAFGPGPEGNLPVAVGIENGLRSFRDFLRTVEQEFVIDGLDGLQTPQGWSGII